MRMFVVSRTAVETIRRRAKDEEEARELAKELGPEDWTEVESDLEVTEWEEGRWRV